jgi:hypothetical protein
MTRDTYDMFSPPDRGRFGDNEQRAPKGRVTGASDLIDLKLQLRQERPLAIMVSDPAQGANAPWISLPRSQIEYVADGAFVTVTLPEWLAREKGLV